MADQKVQNKCVSCKYVALATSIGMCYYGSRIVSHYKKPLAGCILAGLGFVGLAILVQRECVDRSVRALND